MTATPTQTPPTVTGEPPYLFVDDDDSIDIDELATAGATRGCNPPVNDRFCPTSKATRGQMAALLPRGARVALRAAPASTDATRLDAASPGASEKQDQSFC